MCVYVCDRACMSSWGRECLFTRYNVIAGLCVACTREYTYFADGTLERDREREGERRGYCGCSLGRNVFSDLLALDSLMLLLLLLLVQRERERDR